MFNEWYKIVNRTYKLWWVNTIGNLVYIVINLIVGGWWQGNGVLYLISFLLLMATWQKREEVKALQRKYSWITN